MTFKTSIIKSLLISLLVTIISVTEAQNVTYNVVSHYPNDQNSIGVLIDNNKIPYLLTVSTQTPYIFTGDAPVAKIGYKYIIRNNNDGAEISEPFTRSPSTEASYNEFFGISMNTHPIPEFPQIYPPLSSIHRAVSNIHKDDQIPTFFLLGTEADIKNMHSNIFISKFKIALNLTHIGLNEVHTVDSVEVQVSGRGTRYSLKPSYKLDMGKENRLFGYRRLKLRALVTDPSFMRDKLAYDLIRSFGLASTGYSFARVFINNKPYGLFGVQEDFDEPWLANEFNNGNAEDYNHGALFTGKLKAPLKYLGENETRYTEKQIIFNQSSYRVEVPARKDGEKLPANIQRIIDFTKFLSTAPSTQSDAVAIWNQQIDTESVLRSLALEIFLGNSDGYIFGSANYNLFVRSIQTEQITFIPSDMDLVFGSSSVRKANITIYSGLENHPNYNNEHPLFFNILKVPEFRTLFETMLKKAFENLDLVYRRIDAFSGLIQEDVDWDSLIARDYVVLPSLAETFRNAKFNAEPGQVPEDMETMIDYASRIEQDKISFEVAVNGTINRSSIMGLKQWISLSADSYLKATNTVNIARKRKLNKV
ncbi:coth protein-domain-containing protein [Pilaira anomala]|nr:coth protein-domain-containing protein [Pilaira anomala]